MSHVTHTNESCLTYERVMSHIRTSHVSHTNESRLTYERVMSHISYVSHKADTQFNFDVTRMIESRLTYECVTSRMYHTKQTPTLTFMSLTCLSRVSHMNESYHTYHVYHTKQTNDSSFYQSSSGRLAKAGMYVLFIFFPIFCTANSNFLFPRLTHIIAYISTLLRTFSIRLIFFSLVLLYVLDFSFSFLRHHAIRRTVS